jgi:hypothetical protein
MTTLHKHIQNQQDISTNLCGVMEALAILDNEGCAPGAVTALISVGRSLAESLNQGLDSVNLPEVRA